jgi:hypothetical protein
MPHGLFIVRATVADAGRRAAFDDWYRTEHLPDAVRAFGADKAWRFWSATNPAEHVAVYRLPDGAAAEAVAAGAEARRLVADFDRDWPGVTRTREILALAETLSADPEA